MEMNYDTPGGRGCATVVAMDWVISLLTGSLERLFRVVESMQLMMRFERENEDAKTTIAGILVPLIELQIATHDTIEIRFGVIVANLARAASLDARVSESEREQDLQRRAEGESISAVKIRLTIMRYRIMQTLLEPSSSLNDLQSLVCTASQWYAIGARVLGNEHAFVMVLGGFIQAAQRRLS